MSALNQSNGKKGSNISVSNTPVSTPVTNTTNGNSQAATQSTPPPNNAPKYGTLVPNRIFVGGISSNTTEGELLQLFSSYGTVKAAKIIQDRAGVSKGYGFITFESEDDAKRPLRDSESIVLRERKLNIAPAIKKQPFNRGFDGSSPPTVAPGNAQYFFSPPVPFYQGGVAYYNQPPPPAPGDPTAQAATVYQAPPVYPPQTGPPQATTYPSVMFPAQTLYMPQQYPMPIPYEYSYYPGGGAGPAQYVVGNQGGAQGAPQLQQPPSASSPPRGPACYSSQQLATYGAPEPAVFYGIPPMYAPMDTASASLYTDCVDITNGGAYSEEPYMDYKIDPTSTLMIENGSSLIVQPEVIYSPKSTETSADSATTASQALQPPSQQQLPDSASNIDTTRQSNTPVVSLLSIDHHQEKDYLSMQSGRRRKSNPALPNMNTYTNGYNTFSNLNMYTAPPPLTYHPGSYQNAFYNGMQPPQPVGAAGPSMNHQEGYRYGKPMVNGYDRSKKRRLFNNDRRNGESSSRSSMHPDSNSSSSIVDENKNEERKGLPQQKTQISSSFTYSSNNNNVHNNNTSHIRINSTGARGYRNAAGRSVHSNASFGDRKMYNNRNINHEQKEPSWPVAVPSSDTNTSLAVRTDSVENSNYNRVSNTVTSSSQVHAAAGNQNFVPPARRNRKSVRKNTGGSSSLNEIGAGDAPLPNQDVGEACKRMESLKL